MHEDYVGFEQARAQAAQAISPLPPRDAPLEDLAGLVAAAEVRALVASPSVTASTKDGYAVRGADLERATAEAPARLVLKGRALAGEPAGAGLGPGEAMAVTTGAALPQGADAVLCSEFARREGGLVLALAPAAPGRNLLRQGADAAPGQVLAMPGQVITPPMVGLLAAAGVSRAPVHPLPRVGLIATGREVVALGQPLPQGSVYASNLAAQAAWLRLHGMTCLTRVVDDQAPAIEGAARELLERCDILLTSGGAWLSERDLVVGALKGLGLELSFRRVRMGPGKGVAFGLALGRPVFCLPGGPPSNEMAFLQLALPACLALAGHPLPGLPEIPARLGQDLSGQEDWTQFWHGRLVSGPDLVVFEPLPFAGRLGAVSASQAIARLPEGQTLMEAGSLIKVQALGQAFSRCWPCS